MKPGDVVRALDRASGADAAGRMMMRSVLWIDPCPALAVGAAAADVFLDVSWAPVLTADLRSMADRGVFDFVLIGEGVAAPAGEVAFRVLRVGGECST